MRENLSFRGPGIFCLWGILIAAVLTGCAGLEKGSGITGSTGPLEAALDPVFAEPRFTSAFWGARVETLDGDVLYDLNGDKLFVPASNLKLITTAAALDLLGPEFTYSTRLEAIGSLTDDGVLEGDLLITGSGDPSLGSWHVTDETNDSRVLFESWIAKIREAGIRSISGDIIGDGRVFTEQYYYGGWEVEDLPYWYAAGSSGLAMEENCFRFISSPGQAVGDQARITILPDTDYVTIMNETRTGEPGSETDIDIVYRDPEGNTVRFARTIALDREPFQQRGSVWDGARYAAFLLMEALEGEGIEVEGGAVNIRSLEDPEQFDRIPPGERRLLAVHTSPPLSRITAIINKPSHNFFADQVLRTLGAQKGKAGDFEGGVEVIEEWLRSIGAPDADHFQMLDGSGLARRNHVQPRQFCAVLRALYNDAELRQVYYDSLPIAGKDGGLDNRMMWDSTRGNVHAKTGYIGGVRSLSGYVTTASHGVVVFSFLVNQNLEGVSEADAVIDAACRILAER